METDFPESASAVGSIESFTMSTVSGLTTRMRRRGRKKIREVMITDTTEPVAAGDQEACTVTVQVQGLWGRCADTWLNSGASHTLSFILSIKPCGSLCCYPTAEIVFENQRTAERDRPRRVLVRAGAEHPAAGQGDLFLGQGVGARGPSESRVAP